MNMHSKNEEGITVVEIEGMVDASRVPEFSSFMIREIQKNEGGVLLDLSKTKYMGSAGLRVLTVAQKQATAKDITFAVCSPNEQMQDLFQVIHLERLMKIFSTRKDAVQALNG